MRKNLLLKISLLLSVTVAFIVAPIVNATAVEKHAVTGAIVGRVLDESGLALPGANILVKELNVGTTTDVNGDFILIDLTDGDYTLQVSFIGYTPVDQNVRIESSVITPVIITLNSGLTMDGEVVVLGDRLKGQAKALSQQYAANNITNIVAADQIGRFPDSNIGDAMKRIPGITMQYDQGEARFGIIRGTAPALNSYMVNGERVPSAEGDTRSVQLDLIPADMIQTIEVNKAITPDMDADAIGGSVNLVTRSAPSGLRISGTAAAGYGLIRQNPIGSGSLVIGNRFFADKLGIIVSGSYYNNKFGSDNVEATWEQDDDGNMFVEEIEVRKYDVQRVRRSVSAAFDFKLAPNHTLFLKGLYNHRDDWENRYRLRYRDLEYQADESAELTGVTIVRETKGGGDDRGKDARLEDQRTGNVSLSGEHIFGKVKTTWSATLAKASEERPDERYIAWETEDVTGVVDIGNPRKPNFTPTSDVSPSAYALNDISTEDQYTEEKDRNFKLNFTIPLNSGYDKDVIKFGGRLRLKEKYRNNKFWSAEPDFESMGEYPVVDQTSSDFQAGNYNVGPFTTANYLGSLDLRNPNLFELEAGEEGIVENFNAEENISGGYAMIDKTIGKQLSFVAGLRIEHTDINYQGFVFSDGEIQQATGSDNYTNVFPSVHARFNATDDLIIRAAWTNSLARPNYYDLVPYRLVENTDEFLGIGNPKLKPTQSMNLDLMGEKYFESVGIISAGGFYKKLTDIIYTYGVDDYMDDDGNTFERFEQPRNGGGADIVGFEVALQRQLTFLPGIWKGIGVYANYTFTKSEAEEIPGREGEELGLPGTAKNMLNTSLSFESKKLVLRLSLNYTSDYVDELGEKSSKDRYYDKQTFLDFNGSYTVAPKWRIFAEANNLTNQPLRYYQGVQARTAQLEYYRQRFTLGVKFDLFDTKE
ncbi:TonB-dependent receptor [Pseudochryseolinea flava]|uniref:TonB-dependent receptor n=1 Tax=Pseudochryseolinea flava TaxID=2059302 RepID=A0A364Y0J1_9BACT|nr:TonB-dependent receptor [Pseudochryseolinea flava]RAW00322.1 TonB-dependent receptor [Pseudochryseolinea flava]